MTNNPIHTDINPFLIVRDPIELIFYEIDRVFADLPDGSSFALPVFVWNLVSWLIDVFLLMTSFHHLFPPVAILHTSLAPRYLFICSGSLILSPPLTLEALTAFQFTRWNFLFSTVPPCQRNFLISILMLFMTSLGANIIKLE